MCRRTRVTKWKAPIVFFLTKRCILVFDRFVLSLDATLSLLCFTGAASYKFTVARYWLVRVHQRFRSMRETVVPHHCDYRPLLTILPNHRWEEMQLVGVTATLTASEYEETYSLDINDFVYITDKAYSKTDVLNMEMLIV